MQRLYVNEERDVNIKFFQEYVLYHNMDYITEK